MRTGSPPHEAEAGQPWRWRTGIAAGLKWAGEIGQERIPKGMWSLPAMGARRQRQFFEEIALDAAGK